ncbi:MAG: ATP-binding protein [Planctomycetes bacterium]|nr:ATP-binding protein [Planctomycetota bacterium]
MLDPFQIQVLNDLNPWWSDPRIVRPAPAAYRRHFVRRLLARLLAQSLPVEILRGPRQVGKTTALLQLVQDLIAAGVSPRRILFARFDNDLVREIRGGLSTLLRWFRTSVREEAQPDSTEAFLFLDEVHKLPRWSEQVKHVSDTFPVRIVVTGSSALLVGKGGRESLAGRTLTTEVPVFQFREVLEAWSPELVTGLPEAVSVRESFDPAAAAAFASAASIPAESRLGVARCLERYFQRGGYPRLHSGATPDDSWADYLVESVLERVLGADIPDLFPVQQPRLLRHVYLHVARLTGQEITQVSAAESARSAGYEANQVTVGRYMHYLVEALLVREFRRYPLARKASSRLPVKMTLTDLGVRNALFRGAPSLASSPPETVGPLVETLVQGCLRGPNLQVHWFRDNLVPGNRKTPVLETDFVLEETDGRVVPVEVKFRRTISGEDIRGLRHFMERFDSPCGILVTRDSRQWNAEKRILSLPLLDFLVRFGGV